MNPGELRCQITMERLVKVEDDSGGYVECYQPYAGAWAKIAPASLGQQDQAEQTAFRAVYDMTIRCRKDIRADDRITYKGRRFYQIAPALNINEKNAYVKLSVEEIFEHE